MKKNLPLTEPLCGLPLLQDESRTTAPPDSSCACPCKRNFDLGSSIKGGSLPLAVVCTAQVDAAFLEGPLASPPDVISTSTDDRHCCNHYVRKYMILVLGDARNMWEASRHCEHIISCEQRRRNARSRRMMKCVSAGQNFIGPQPSPDPEPTKKRSTVHGVFWRLHLENCRPQLTY